jgi:hypothetical protein
VAAPRQTDYPTFGFFGGRKPGPTSFGLSVGGVGGERWHEQVVLAKKVTAEFLGPTDKQGTLSKFSRILRSPTRRTLELVEDPNYRNHAKFVRQAIYLNLITTGIFTAYMYSSEFWQHAKQQHKPGNGLGGYIWQTFEFSEAYSKFLTPFLTYADFVLFYIVAYFLFTAMSPNRRTPREYLRLRCPISGVYSVALHHSFCCVRWLASPFSSSKYF